MTPEQQNRAIAEWLGWTELRSVGGYLIGVRPGETRTFQTTAAWSPSETKLYLSKVPNFTGSLDAMHEAAHCLRSKGDQFQWFAYHKRLFEVVWPSSRVIPAIGDGHAWHVIEATAVQRAEAFLRAIGLWEKREGEK